MSRTESNILHNALKQDAEQLIEKHMSVLPSDQVLAVLSQLVGMTLALQDQNTMTPDRGLLIIGKNIEIGNQMVVDDLVNNTGGSA